MAGQREDAPNSRTGLPCCRMTLADRWRKKVEAGGTGWVMPVLRAPGWGWVLGGPCPISISTCGNIYLLPWDTTRLNQCLPGTLRFLGTMDYPNHKTLLLTNSSLIEHLPTTWEYFFIFLTKLLQFVQTLKSFFMNAESEGSQLSGLTLGHRRQVCPKKRQFGITLEDCTGTSLTRKKSYYQKTKTTSFPIRLPLVTGLFK